MTQPKPACHHHHDRPAAWLRKDGTLLCDACFYWRATLRTLIDHADRHPDLTTSGFLRGYLEAHPVPDDTLTPPTRRGTS